jgi:Zn-dependent peptidase ImmA (M78 family)/transcriptional regulator with XRE-family HTH domain
MAKAIESSVRPSVLKWARETSGTTVEEAAKRLRVPASTFAKWETVESSLKLGQLRTLATYFKRPLSALLLPEPPPEPALPTDFRTLPGHQRRFDRGTRLAIRKAMRLRSLARDLMQALQREAGPMMEGANLSEDPERLAERERQHLRVSIETQFEWKNPYQAFREWRSALEGKNLLVFQLPMPVEDARGFSLGDEEPFSIVVSSSDAVQARIFTLFHEYGHLLLRDPGICLPKPDLHTTGPHAVVEQWCNRFAGTLLVPTPALRSFLGAQGPIQSEVSLSEAIREGEKRFRVSRQVVLRRVFDVRLLAKASFQRAMKGLLSQQQAHKAGGGRVEPAKKCLAENGHLFTSLVLEASARGVINYSEVADYLSLRLKYLREVESDAATAA